MSRDAALQRINEILQNGRKDPARAIQACADASDLASALARAPYTATEMYMPGAWLPGNRLISVDSIPNLTNGPFTGTPVPIELTEPGVVVGLHATLAGEPDQVGWVDFQLSLEGDKNLVTNIQGLTQAFAPLSIFPTGWAMLPVMIPSRGAGRWSVQFRNRDAAHNHQPVFALEFLAGQKYLDRFG